MSQIVTATDDADESDLQEIEAIPEVQSILDELNYNKIPRNISVTTTEVGPETSDASITNVEFNLGMLQVATAGEAVFATFRFDENKDSESKKKRESDDEVQKSASQHSYRKHRNLPSDSEAWLHGTETDAKLYRTATSEEYKDALSQAPVEDTDNIMVYTHEDINGFYVEAPPQKPTLKATNTNEKLSTSYLVPAGDVSVESVTTQIISSPAKKAARTIARSFAKELGWQGIDQVDDSCGAKIGSCLDGVLGTLDCLKCGPICSGSVTGLGAVMCFLCVMTTCSQIYNTASCVSAVQCVENA